MVVPAGSVNRTQLSNLVEAARSALGPDVVRITHTIGTDTSGDPAIYFRIVLSDSAASEDKLAHVTGKIVATLWDEVRPYENWGLYPYFSFRSSSEQSADREWA